MNLYVRYFERETLATNMDDVVDFLNSIGEFKVDDNVVNRIINFVESDDIYPFRLKVSYSNYVLFLKTDAKDLAEFHEFERLRKEERAEGRSIMVDRKKTQLDILNEPRKGWYDATILFKRVVLNPETGKCKYVDTRFRVKLVADSAMHCYDRIIEHLQNRQDVDPRSQFPSAKSVNFEYSFLGDEIEYENTSDEDDKGCQNEMPFNENDDNNIADKQNVLDDLIKGTENDNNEAEQFAS